MRYIEAKTILGKNNNVNLYRGCTHGCIYCDSRSDCYQVGDFENIGVKKDALLIFEKELLKRRKKCIISTGAMSDPYVHLEKKLELTKGFLEIIKDHYFGISVLTKSNLILRDIDLYEEINHRYRAIVWMTITTYNDILCQKIERNVCVTSERFKCLAEFAKRGIPTGIWLTPILPFINDNEENITRIVNKCAEVGVKYIMIFDFGTTKRAGSEEYFYQNLDLYFPGLKEKYQKTYRNDYICNSLNNQKLWIKFRELCDQHQIIYQMDKIKDVFQNVNNEEQLRLF